MEVSVGFFFQAEDGIRDLTVTGVQTCALPIYCTTRNSSEKMMLIGVGFGVLGLVSIIFSLLFLVVQWAFSSLSPRLNLFRDDPIVWRTFGLAVGVVDRKSVV